MSQFNPDSNPEGDWDDRGETTWNEEDWRRYLIGSEREINRYIAVYMELGAHPKRLDEAARLMGWELREWSLGEIAGDEPEDDELDESMAPYTMHRHPVYVSTSGLCRLFADLLEEMVQSAGDELSAKEAWRISNSLLRLNRDTLMAVTALDMGDYALSICHMKQALATVNNAFAALPSRPDIRAKISSDAFLVLFDLREIALRVMRDCREELRFRSDED